jgi:hypothetical protein
VPQLYEAARWQCRQYQSDCISVPCKGLLQWVAFQDQLPQPPQFAQLGWQVLQTKTARDFVPLVLLCALPSTL